MTVVPFSQICNQHQNMTYLICYRMNGKRRHILLEVALQIPHCGTFGSQPFYKYLNYAPQQQSQIRFSSLSHG